MSDLVGTWDHDNPDKYRERREHAEASERYWNAQSRGYYQAGPGIRVDTHPGDRPPTDPTPAPSDPYDLTGKNAYIYSTSELVYTEVDCTADGCSKRFWFGGTQHELDTLQQQGWPRCGHHPAPEQPGVGNDDTTPADNTTGVVDNTHPDNEQGVPKRHHPQQTPPCTNVSSANTSTAAGCWTFTAHLTSSTDC